MAAVIQTGANEMQTIKISSCYNAHSLLNKLTDLQHEAGEAPRVVVHDDSPAVSNHLNGAANSDQRSECPLLPAVALVDVNKHADAENGDEDCVGGKVRLVLKDAPLDAACFEVAFAPTSLLRFIGSHCLWFGSKPWVDES